MFSLIETLFKDPKWFFEFSLYRVPAALIALVLHEWAHAYVAYRLGDPTAKSMGRLTLNPIKHLEPVGAVLMFFAGFGWARPVPINPNNFRNKHRDDLLVSIAGVTMNFLLFLFFTSLSVYLSHLLWFPGVLKNYSLYDLLGHRSDSDVMKYIINGYGQVFSEAFARPHVLWMVRMASQIAIVNLYIAFFNLIPIPPLDGSHVLNDLVLKGDLFASGQLARAGIGILLILSFTGVLGTIMGFLTDNVQRFVLFLISAVIGA